MLEIEDVGDDSDKAFLMGTVLIRLVEHLRMVKRATSSAPAALRHLTVIEEAHRLLRRPEAPGSGALRRRGGARGGDVRRAARRDPRSTARD